MIEQGWSTDDLFRWFVMQQQQSAMILLGKLVHPGTGKVERDLDSAKLTIDILGMLQEKTRGNLREEDDRMLGQVLATLRLNFVDESRRPQEPAGGEGKGPEAGHGGDGPPEPASPAPEGAETHGQGRDGA